MGSIERALFSAFKNDGVLPEHQKSILGFLERLKRRSREHYAHSVRTALLASKIGRHLNTDPKAFLFVGALHDIGKIKIPGKVLGKKGAFTKTDKKNNGQARALLL
ncbi:MAG: HD domain-containing protein [Candidatus Diapherotrites archaeon]|nr:HD domain-containing protein [Candidatus Diapherotrites archaeon]